MEIFHIVRNCEKNRIHFLKSNGIFSELYVYSEASNGFFESSSVFCVVLEVLEDLW